MKKWRLKAVIQKVISYLPYSMDINTLFQKHITKGLELNDEHFAYKLKAAQDHHKYFAKYSPLDLADAKILELGTGWYPIVPLYLWLHGANTVSTIDLRKWTSADRMRTTCSKFLEKKNEIVTTDTLLDRWDLLQKMTKEDQTEESMFETIGLLPWVGDARELPYDSGSFNFICSNNTYEHIYPDILVGINKEFLRVINHSEGVMSHFIDMSDHFAHMDKTITVYNFLQFSKSQWSKIDNSIQPQNRWRLRDYCNLYERFDIPITEIFSWPYSEELLDQQEIHSEYSDYSREDLAVIHSYIISSFSKK